jgi:uncharacterized membrane protein YeaQ/YmgE (transglycosylase-associated protein family)
MGILLWIVFGIIVGAIARWVVPGEGPGGIIGDLVVGIIGALLGGFIYHLFGHTGITGFNVGSFICAIIGAIVLLWIIRVVTGRRSVA